MGAGTSVAEPLTTVGTAEFVDLEELWVVELPCEFEHVKSTCSIEVTHRIIDCETDVNICENAARFQDAAMEVRGQNPCSKCNHPISECWRIIKIS